MCRIVFPISLYTGKIRSRLNPTIPLSTGPKRSGSSGLLLNLILDGSNDKIWKFYFAKLPWVVYNLYMY